MIRIVITLMAAFVLLGCAAAAFWYQDLQYAIPTPRPPDLVQISIGKEVELANLLPITMQRNKAQFLHFFNPSCPCSRFNVDHLQYLTRHYSTDVQFIAVLQVEKDEYAAALEKFRDLKLNIEAVIDTTGAIADYCGVYSTPQAVILDNTWHLYYRGNYNLSRFCTNTSTEFARIALDSLVKGAKPPVFEQKEAIVAYGCELPANLVQEKP